MTSFKAGTCTKHLRSSLPAAAAGAWTGSWTGSWIGSWANYWSLPLIGSWDRGIVQLNNTKSLNVNAPLLALPKFPGSCGYTIITIKMDIDLKLLKSAITQ